MKQWIVLCILFYYCLGCGEVSGPTDVNVQVDTVHPIAKLVRSLPSTDETVNIKIKYVPSTQEIVSTGDTITLEFTAVPENLKLSAFNLQRPTHANQHPVRFSICQFEYNGNTQARFEIAAENVQMDRLGLHHVRVSVQWTHGYKALSFDVKLSELN